MPAQAKVDIKGAFHIAIIKDVDQTMARFWKDLGIGPWQQMTIGPLKTSLLYGKPAPSFAVKAAATQVGFLMLAIDQPLTKPHPYEDIVNKRGGGAHHLAFVVEQMEQATEQMRRLGYTEILAGTGIGPYGDGAGSYFDTVENMGTVIELAKLPREMPATEKVYPAPDEVVGTSNLKIRGAVHVAIAVRDAEKAARHYQEELGIGPWKIFTFGSDDVNAATYLGKKVPLKLKAAYIEIGPFVLVLEQPLTSPSPLQDFLDKNGQGIHHLCLAVDALAPAAEEMRRLGYEETFSAYGFGPNKDGESAYFDTENALGIVIELAKVPTGNLF